MRIKKKSWIWKLTGPFASSNYTTIGNTIYCPDDKEPSEQVRRHEEIHYRQQKEQGIGRFLFKYLFLLPLFWNPFRFKWEMEAYQEGTGLGREAARSLLRSSAYGWLLHK